MILNCMECNKILDDEECYVTDCFEGFGDALYCKDCIMKGVVEGFNDPKLICSCGEKMLPNYFANFDLEHDEDGEEKESVEVITLDIFDRKSMLYYCCLNNKCPYKNCIGVYTNQRDDVLDLVYERGVHPDELEHEYIYDYEYTLNYHIDNPALYQQPYTPDWKEEMIEWGIEIE